MIGRTLLHYEVGAELGAGGMGRVYLARDLHTGRRVALKLLGPEAIGPRFRERLKREAQAAARLSHPGIVTLFALEETEGELFLVQELVEGDTLARRLAHGRLDPAEVLRLARELTAALSHAHGHGVVHRDLKPENILVAADGSYKIADFGIARIEGMPMTTTDGTLVGTLPYTAPERLRGHRGDAGADLFALGAILYEAISGRRAFPGLTEAEVCYAIMNQDPSPIEDPPRSLAPLVPLVQRLLAKEPSQRPASAESVALAIDPMTARPAPVPWLRLTWRVTAAVGVAGLIALALLRPRLAPVGPRFEAAGLVVMPFENVSEPEDPGHFASIVTYLLITSLAQADPASVVSSERMLEILNQVRGRDGAANRRDARMVARRAQVGRIVTGRILRRQPTLVVTAELSEAARGRVLQAARVEGLPDQTVFEVVDALSRQISRSLIASGPPSGAPPPLTGSRNLEANRRYVDGLEHWARGELPQADRAFASALERDPSFEQARYQLALIHWLEASRTPRETP